MSNTLKNNFVIVASISYRNYVMPATEATLEILANLQEVEYELGGTYKRCPPTSIELRLVPINRIKQPEVDGANFTACGIATVTQEIPKIAQRVSDEVSKKIISEFAVAHLKGEDSND